MLLSSLRYTFKFFYVKSETFRSFYANIFSVRIPTKQRSFLMFKLVKYIGVIALTFVQPNVALAAGPFTCICSKITL